MFKNTSPNFCLSKTAIIWTKQFSNTWHACCIKVHSAFQEEEAMGGN